MRRSAELVELEPTNAIILWEEVLVSLEEKRFDHLAEKKKALQARYVYGIIFLITNLCAWFVRDYGQRVLPELHCELACVSPGWWNKYWMPDEHKKLSYSLGLLMSTLFYIASMCEIALMYSSYAMKSSCALNIFFIIWTAVLLILMMSASLHSKGIPEQQGDQTYGFWIMRYMKDIVEDKNQEWSAKWDRKGSNKYTQADIDEVWAEWAQYVAQFQES